MKYDLAKTLFVTDLDGTLLRSDGMLAEETAAAFNHMAAAGMKLTFATARSYHTATNALTPIKRVKKWTKSALMKFNSHQSGYD